MKRAILVLVNYVVGLNFVYPLITYVFTESVQMRFFVPQLVALLINLLLICHKLKEDSKNLSWKKVILESLVTTVLMFFVLIVVLSSNAILVQSGTSNNQETLENIFSSSQLKLAVTASILIVAPIVEESVFRYGIWNVLPKKLQNDSFFTLISALLFGFIHVVSSLFSKDYLDLLNFIPYSILGVVLALSFIKNKQNLIFPIFAHMFYNGVQLCLMMLLMK